jgi:hypothetical protein
MQMPGIYRRPGRSFLSGGLEKARKSHGPEGPWQNRRPAALNELLMRRALFCF